MHSSGFLHSTSASHPRQSSLQIKAVEMASFNFNTHLARFFYKLGYQIAKRPKVYLILSVLVAAAFSTGVFNYIKVKDVDYLYTPTTGDSKSEILVMAKHFPQNDTNRFDPSRIIKLRRFSRIIITSKREDGNLINNEVWKEIAKLDEIVHSVNIEWKGTHNYSTLCSRWKDTCYENEILELGALMPNITSGAIRLSYPIMFNPDNFHIYPLPQYMGSVTLTNDSFSVDNVKAMHLNYFISATNEEEYARGAVWESELIRKLTSMDSSWKEIKVLAGAFEAIADEVEHNLFSIIPYAVLTVVIMIVFVVWSTMMRDCVRSKPWLGVAGVFSALLGTIASFGILMYAGVPFIALNIAVPLLMIGIGVDDSFVMISAWRCTDPTDSVPKRLAQAYSDAAVSVTITSVTDMVSFYIGVFTPIPALSIFSLYAGTGVLCIYFWHLFFFGAAMAISGYHEEQNRHAVFWWMTAVPKSKAENRSTFFRLFFTGGINEDDPKNIIDNCGTENFVMTFFRDKFAPAIMTTRGKTLIAITFILYLMVAVYGVTKLKEGLRREKLVRYDSYMSDFFIQYENHFNKYPYRIQIAVTNPMDYSDPLIQQKISTMLDRFSSLEFMTSEYNENWLESYTRHLEVYKEFLNVNITNEQEFINYLTNEYFNDDAPVPISQDVKFNENKTKIISTRYILQAINIQTTSEEKRAVEELRNLAKDLEMELGLNITVYQFGFHFIDQYIMIRGITIKLVSLAAILVMVVAVVFIPNLTCALCVLFSIASIELGVLGFMSLWGVNLDILSTICLIMCIGFSVDFSAHISFTYVTCKSSTPLDRMKSTMFSLGFPILQGGISTIIGVLSMAFIPSYLFHVFAKVVVLVIIFATFHSLFVLPVILTILQPGESKSARFGCFKTKGFTLSHELPVSESISVYKNHEPK